FLKPPRSANSLCAHEPVRVDSMHWSRLECWGEHKGCLEYRDSSRISHPIELVPKTSPAAPLAVIGRTSLGRSRVQQRPMSTDRTEDPVANAACTKSDDW